MTCVFLILLLFHGCLFAKTTCDTVLIKNEQIVICTTYYSNGNIDYISLTLDGKRHGIDKSYHETGQLARIGTYNRGELIQPSAIFLPEN